MNDMEQRLRAIEDRLAIYQVVCGYGYAVDGCNTDAAASFFSEDGVYEIGALATLKGRDRIAGITKDEAHLDLVKTGVAHVSTLPFVVIDGERASATFHTLIMRKTEGGFTPWRVGACRMELSRQPDGGWQVDHRLVHQQDGGPEGPALLARLTQPPAVDASV